MEGKMGTTASLVMRRIGRGSTAALVKTAA